MYIQNQASLPGFAFFLSPCRSRGGCIRTSTGIWSPSGFSFSLLFHRVLFLVLRSVQILPGSSNVLSCHLRWFLLAHSVPGSAFAPLTTNLRGVLRTQGQAHDGLTGLPGGGGHCNARVSHAAWGILTGVPEFINYAPSQDH